MLISLTTLFATRSSIFRSRAALELENLALRHLPLRLFRLGRQSLGAVECSHEVANKRKSRPASGRLYMRITEAW